MKEKNIIFICHGNICRSPMAEFVFKKLVRDAGRDAEFAISSMAVSDEETGNPIYPPAKAKMREHGIPFDDHRAHKITPSEFQAADLVLIMDESNRRLLRRLVGPSADGPKVRKLMEFAPESAVISGTGSASGTTRSAFSSSSTFAPDVADPWYTGDFETAYRNILDGCRGLLKAV